MYPFRKLPLIRLALLDTFPQGGEGITTQQLLTVGAGVPDCPQAAKVHGAKMKQTV